MEDQPLKNSPRVPSPQPQEQQMVQCPRKEQVRLQFEMLSVLGSVREAHYTPKGGANLLKIFNEANTEGAGGGRGGLLN